MNNFSLNRCQLEKFIREKINESYPIIFNRINWDVVDEYSAELLEFQKTHTDLLPLSILYGLNDENNKKCMEIIGNDREKRIKLWAARESRTGMIYDELYEFLQKFPQWRKLVFYDDDPNRVFDEFLTIHHKNYPIIFNRINWKVVGTKINDLYKLVQKEKKPVIPEIFFMWSPGGVKVSKKYEEIAHNIAEFYEKEEEGGNKLFGDWWHNSYNYDFFFEFIQLYPEFSDLVYFDEAKV